jgi:uncharacterized protein (TIGR03086 family)
MDVEAAYRRSVDAWIAAVEGVGDDWARPTPCTEWTVRQLTNHVVGEDRWTKPLLEGKTIAEVGDSLDGNLLGNDPVTAATGAAEQAVAAVAARLPNGGLVHLSYGEEEVAEYIRQLTADHLIHAWDLTAATGQDRTLDADLVDTVGAWYAEREATYRAAGAVGPPPVSVSGGSPAAELLIAFGRDPDW